MHWQYCLVTRTDTPAAKGCRQLSVGEMSHQLCWKAVQRSADSEFSGMTKQRSTVQRNSMAAKQRIKQWQWLHQMPARPVCRGLKYSCGQ